MSEILFLLLECKQESKLPNLALVSDLFIYRQTMKLCLVPPPRLSLDLSPSCACDTPFHFVIISEDW